MMHELSRRVGKPRQLALATAAVVAAVLLDTAGLQAQTLPEVIDSTDLPGPTIDDFTTHTYVVSAGSRGSFADRTVIRRFAKPIRELRLTIVDGDADDIGYVGSTLVTDVKPSCAGVGRVLSPVDVTDQVTVSGSEATLVLRAQENCCCVTGWGSATQGDRRDARLHWEVTLGEAPEFKVNLTTFIPSDHVPGPPFGPKCGQGRDRQALIFGGDNRGFSPDATSFRTRQLVTLVADETVDPDGVVDGSHMRIPGLTRAYAEDALADGVVDAADDDGVLNDCHLLHDVGSTDMSSVSVESVRPVGGGSVLVRLSGEASNPLVNPSPGIGWDMFLQITVGEEEAQYLLVGSHDGFPAYEIYVNGAEIYTHDPGAPPYNFLDLFKLFPPLDVGVSKTGSLPLP